MSAPPDLIATHRAVIDEEEALLARVQTALAAAIEAAAWKPGGELQSAEGLRAVRDEAAGVRAEDLPAILQELEVRSRLVERRATAGPLPDPRSPYLAHLRVDEGSGARDYLLGSATFLEKGIRIIDWRVAPIAQIFYRHREGDKYEEDLPGRVARGVILVRRVLVVEKGVLTRIVGDGVALARNREGQWDTADRAALSMLPGGAGTAARPGILGVGAGASERAGAADVTAMLDADQYAAITSSPERPLLVLGSAGSGKTTVALHRLARVSAAESGKYPMARIRVVVPEEGLARLSRRLLEPLGAAEASVKTLDAWAFDLAGEVFGKKAMLCPYPPPLVTTLKRHPALYDAIAKEFDEMRPGTRFESLRRFLARFLTDRGFLEGVVEAANGGIRHTAILETMRHTELQIAEPERASSRALRAGRGSAPGTEVEPEWGVGVDGRPIGDGSPAELAGTLDVDDLPILMFLLSRREKLEAKRYVQLVLDEAEDFSLFELSVLQALTGDDACVTIAGDDAQQTSSSFPGWERLLETLGASGAARVRLATSYRCPRPVLELARKLLGALAPESATKISREGAPVGRFQFPTEAQAQIFLAGALRDLLDREPRASVGVIASSEDAARRFYRLFAEVADVRLVLEGEFSFEPGIDVTDVENAKGLEFDYVVVPDASAQNYPESDEARRRLHVAVTRASHQLWIVASGAPSPLL